MNGPNGSTICFPLPITHTFANFNAQIITGTKNLTAAEAGYANLAKATIQPSIPAGRGSGRGAGRGTSRGAGRGPYQIQIVDPSFVPPVGTKYC